MLWLTCSVALAQGRPEKERISESAVQAVINHLTERDPRFGQRRPAEFIESGPLSELDRSGAIDRLYGGQEGRGKADR